MKHDDAAEARQISAHMEKALHHNDAGLLRSDYNGITLEAIPESGSKKGDRAGFKS